MHTTTNCNQHLRSHCKFYNSKNCNFTLYFKKKSVVFVYTIYRLIFLTYFWGHNPTPVVRPTLAASVGRTAAMPVREHRMGSSCQYWCRWANTNHCIGPRVLAKGRTAPLLCQQSWAPTRAVLGRGGRKELGGEQAGNHTYSHTKIAVFQCLFILSGHLEGRRYNGERGICACCTKCGKWNLEASVSLCTQGQIMQNSPGWPLPEKDFQNIPIGNTTHRDLPIPRLLQGSRQAFISSMLFTQVNISLNRWSRVAYEKLYCGSEHFFCLPFQGMVRLILMNSWRYLAQNWCLQKDGMVFWGIQLTAYSGR